MATIYHYDLYPRTDPRDGTRLVRFSSLQKATYRDVMGVGSGVGILRSTHADADFLDPLGEQYVRVVEDTDAVETVVGGFWLSDTRHQTAVRRETKRLTIAGPGVMAYLARASMAPHTYLDIAIGSDPYDDQWRLYAQGPVAGGDHLGAVLWRVVYEAQHFRVALTEHRHKDGLIYTDSHSLSDRTATAIPELVLGFDAFTDSDGNDWTLPSGQFTAQVGENLLGVVQRLMQAGLYVEMDPDTFELRAWESRPASRGGRSTDRTGTAWASDVVLFQVPTDGTVETGNIKSDTESRFKSFLRRTLMWAGGGDVYAKATGSSDIPWEGFEPANLQDTSGLQQLASSQIMAADEAADSVDPKMKLGDDPANGRYRPWQEVRIDELVTVHTGTSTWDFDNRTFPVAALRIELQKGGDWAAWAELGASFEAGRERRFQVAPPGTHSHPPNPRLCDPASGAGQASCVLDTSAMDAIDTPNGDFEMGDGTNWIGVSAVDAGDPEGVGGVWHFFDIGAGSGGISYEGWGGATAGVTYVLRGYADGTGGLTVWFGDRDSAGASASGDFVTTAPDGHFCIEWTPSANRTKMRAQIGRAGSGSLTIDNLQLYTGGVGSNPLHGTSVEAARCDHQHHWHSQTDPGVDDDESRGFPVGTLWINDATDTVYISTDDTDGAAVWLELGGGVTDHGALSGLGDDDHPQYQTEAEVDAQITAAVATIEASDLATRWTPVTTWNGDHWIMVTDGSGTPVLTEVS